MPELDTDLPSVRQLQGFIKDGQELELKLLNGDILTGKLRWLDPNCLCLLTADEQPITIWCHAIAYLKPL